MNKQDLEKLLELHIWPGAYLDDETKEFVKLVRLDAILEPLMQKIQELEEARDFAENQWQLEAMNLEKHCSECPRIKELEEEVQNAFKAGEYKGYKEGFEDGSGAASTGCRR